MTGVTPRLVYVIAGPTASGKSGLALALAEHLDGVVINGDSMQVYKGLEILTDQPGAKAAARAPHRLYGILDPSEPCSAGRWRDMALAEIERAFAEQHTPVVVGGSGLYLKSLIEGIAPVPDIPASLRTRLRARCAEIGNEAFHGELMEKDPDGAARIRATDGQRMIRAMEVVEATGRTLGSWQEEPPSAPPVDIEFKVVLLMPPRAEIYAAIEARFDLMIEAGAIAEAEALIARGLDADLPVMKALGVCELAAAACGEMDMEEAIMQAKTVSRNYAKRQITWFNGQIITQILFSTKYLECFREKMLSNIL